ncbi:MAG: glutamine amidotransferase [Acidimicrobiia bacterium]|nr:glutamine amidotransferase [Acidimicrobiia bacterium]
MSGSTEIDLSASAEPTGPGYVLRIVVLYPELMDVYADRGNLLAVRARCRTLGVGTDVTMLDVGDPMPDDADLVLIGGGQDREQRYVERDLHERGSTLRSWVEADAAMLAVCGGFQLFGHSYRTADGDELAGVGVFDCTTVAPPPGSVRFIGDVWGDAHQETVGDVVGFENHSGRTTLAPSAVPFARVRHGYGNNGEDGTEGAAYREAIGTYLHGPLLPKNPDLRDRLILAGLRHRYGRDVTLDLPPDPMAERAHASAVAVARKRGAKKRGRKSRRR